MVVIKLIVINMVGKTLTIKAQQNSVVINFLDHICSVQKLALGQYRLMYEGKEIDENQTFSQQNIKDNSILLLTLKDQSIPIKNEPIQDKSIYQVQAVSRYIKQKTVVEEKMLQQHRALIDEQKKISQIALSQDKSEKSISKYSQQSVIQQKLLMKKSSEMLQRHQTELKRLAQNQSSRIITYEKQISEYRQKQKIFLLSYIDQINKQLAIQSQRLNKHIIEVNNQIKKQEQRLIQFREEVNQQINKQYQILQRQQRYALFADQQLRTKQKALHARLQSVKRQQSIKLQSLKQHPSVIMVRSKQEISHKSQQKALQFKRSEKSNIQGNMQVPKSQEHYMIVLKEQIQRVIQQRKIQVERLTEKIKIIQYQINKQQDRLNYQINAIDQQSNVEKVRLREYQDNINMLLVNSSKRVSSKIATDQIV